MCTNPRKIIVNNEEVIVKCGKCDTCRREKSQEWAIKLINYSKYFKKSCFITLTFDNKILLDKNSIAVKKYKANPSYVFNIKYSMEYFQRFIKRLRQHYKNKYITYYHIAEYGEKTHRPHHHALIFGINFTENEEKRTEMQISKSGHVQYYSEILNKLWACGRCSIQDINPYNIMYISQYAVKKFKKKDDKYKEKQTFSNRSKMSTRWVRRNYNEIIKGYILDKDGHKYRIPQSYKNTLKNSDKEIHREAYRQYEENLMERFSNIDNTELLKRQKNKEEILKIRNKEKTRDF